MTNDPDHHSSQHETTPPSQSTDDCVRRILGGLRTALRLTGISHRHCERELGLSTGYLTRILAGEVRLKMDVVIDLCRLMDLPYSAFISTLFPPPQISKTADRVLRGLGGVHCEPSSGQMGDVLLKLRDLLRSLEAMGSSSS